MFEIKGHIFAKDKDRDLPPPHTHTKGTAKFFTRASAKNWVYNKDAELRVILSEGDMKLQSCCLSSLKCCYVSLVIV